MAKRRCSRLVAAGAIARLHVEMVRYRPGDVPMVGEFASAQAIDAGERESVVARFREPAAAAA